MKQIRILHLISSSGVYGAENVILSLVREFKPPEYEVKIGCLFDERRGVSPLSNAARRLGFKTESIHCRGRLDLSTLYRIRSLIHRDGVNILHCHGYKGDIYGLLAGKLARVALISTSHGFTRDGLFLRAYEAVDRLCLRHFDRVVAVSEQIAFQLEKSGVLRGSVSIIGNGVDTDRFKVGIDRDKARRDLGLKDGATVIGIVGRLSPEKGHRYFLKSAVEVARKIPEAVFLVVGGGYLEGEFKAYVKNVGIEDRVIFTGPRDDMPAIYAAIDIFVCSSLREGSPMAVLEAMAARKPVVATAVGSVPGIIRNGQTGLLVGPGDSEGLTQAILSLVWDVELANRLGKSGMHLVETEFSATAMALKYKKLYRELIGYSG